AGRHPYRAVTEFRIAGASSGVGDQDRDDAIRGQPAPQDTESRAGILARDEHSFPQKTIFDLRPMRIEEAHPEWRVGEAVRRPGQLYEGEAGLVQGHLRDQRAVDEIADPQDCTRSPLERAFQVGPSMDTDRRMPAAGRAAHRPELQPGFAAP